MARSICGVGEYRVGGDGWPPGRAAAPATARFPGRRGTPARPVRRLGAPCRYSVSRMRVAVISDIHANLRRPRRGARRRSTQAGVDEIWCLGDLVGYGPDPDACVAAVDPARRRLPRRKPRPGGDRRDRHRGVRLRRRHRRALDRRDDHPRDAWRSSERSRPAASAPASSSTTRSIRDPVWEYVIDNHTAAVLPRAAVVAAGADRPQPRAADVRVRRARSSSRGSPRPTPRSRLPAARFCSTPGRSASRATATPGPPTCCSTSTASTATWKRVAYDIAATQRVDRRRGLPREAGHPPERRQVSPAHVLGQASPAAARLRRVLIPRSTPLISSSVTTPSRAL